MDEHCRNLDRGQLDELFGIERKNMKFAPGPPGLRRVSDEFRNLPQRLDKVRTAETGVAAAGAGRLPGVGVLQTILASLLPIQDQLTCQGL
jgi:hypothetical protein